MGSNTAFLQLRGDYSFRELFFIIVFVQVLVSSVLTAQFYLIQNKSSSEFTIIKSFPVATITSCVLECSVSPNICNKTEIEIKENGQKVCHLLQEKPQEEIKELSDENSSESAGNGISNERSFILSPDFSISLINKDCQFVKEESIYIKGWILQKQNLCYDATKHNSNTGLFKATQTGNVTQVKLVHVEGFVQKESNSLKVYWGHVQPPNNCAINFCFGTLIMNANKTIVFPYNTSLSLSNNYNLKGFTNPKSEYITLSRNSNPYMVGRNEKFQIILGAQHKHGQDYYSGTHCMDVYFYFE